MNYIAKKMIRAVNFLVLDCIILFMCAAAPKNNPVSVGQNTVSAASPQSIAQIDLQNKVVEPVKNSVSPAPAHNLILKYTNQDTKLFLSIDNNITLDIEATEQITVLEQGQIYSKCSVDDVVGYITTEHLWDSPYSKEDLRQVAAIIFAEAGNQCYAGKQAVGIVVMNRVQSELFPSTIYEVLHQSGQFTPVKGSGYNKALRLFDAGTLETQCLLAADYVLKNNKTIQYNNTTHDMSSYLYFSRYVKNARLKIEDHQFK